LISRPLPAIVNRSSNKRREPLKPGGRAVNCTLTRLAARNTQQRCEAFRAEKRLIMRYAIVIEKSESNYAAYVPDLPGCVSTGKDIQEVDNNIREAIRLHVEGLREDHLPVPEPSVLCEYIDA